MKSFYDSPAWRELSDRCKRRDGYRCLKCGWRAKTRWDRRRLHAHHLVPRPYGPDTLDNLETRCFECHAEEHPNNRGLNRDPGASVGPYRARLDGPRRAPRPPRHASSNLFRARKRNTWHVP